MGLALQPVVYRRRRADGLADLETESPCILLLLAAAAFHLRVLESSNYWDYLLDPIYCLVSLAALGRRLIGRK